MNKLYCLVEEKDYKEDGREEFDGKIYSKIMKSNSFTELCTYADNKKGKVGIAIINNKNEIIKILITKDEQCID